MTAVISKCLAKDYKKRPSFKELLSSMELLWHSDFTSVNQRDYAQLQKDWQAELGVGYYFYLFSSWPFSKNSNPNDDVGGV